MDRNRKFHKAFKNISQDEILIKHFACAYMGDILLQGFLYLSDNYFCFYTKILGHSKRIQIPIDRIEKLTREKTAFIFPNAIGIWTSEGEKFVFSSLMARDVTYNLMLALLEKKRAIDLEQTKLNEDAISSKVVQQGLTVSVSSSLNKTESSTSSESSIEESKLYSTTRRGKEWFKSNRSVSSHTVTANTVSSSTIPPKLVEIDPITPHVSPVTVAPIPTDSEELKRSKRFLKFVIVMFILLVIMTLVLSYKLIRLETIYERYYAGDKVMGSNVYSKIYNYL